MTARACAPEPPCDCWIVDLLAGLRLPVLGERGVEVGVELARRVVRDVEQRLRVGRAPTQRRTARQSGNPVRLHGHAPRECRRQCVGSDTAPDVLSRN